MRQAIKRQRVDDVDISSSLPSSSVGLPALNSAFRESLLRSEAPMQFTSAGIIDVCHDSFGSHKDNSLSHNDSPLLAGFSTDLAIASEAIIQEISDDAGFSHKASLDKGIEKSNIGYQLLLQMGWVEGKGLGDDFRGRVEPLPIFMDQKLEGLGLNSEMNRLHKATTASRRLLDSEKLEDENAARLKQADAKRKENIKLQVLEEMKHFYCDVCAKQYKKATEWEEHLSSYDHHHRKRFKDMKTTQAKEKDEGAMEREKKREEREIKRLQKAAAQKNLDIKTSTVSAPAIQLPVANSAATQPIVNLQHPSNITVLPAERSNVSFGFRKMTLPKS